MSSFRWIASAAALAALGACSVSYSGAYDTETRPLADFDSIDAGAGVNVVLKQGPFSVSVRAPEGKLDTVRTEKSGSTLRITHDGNRSNWFFFGWSGSSEVTVTAPSYIAISAGAGADVEGDNLQFGDITVKVGSGADIELSGACKTIHVSASSGADFNGEDLKCETAEADASSGADIEVFASATGTGHASSGADIRFHGNPANVTRDTSSGGDIDVDH